MYRIRYIILLLILLFLYPAVSAQKLFREGFIIRKDGVVLEGMIGFTPGQDIPSICIFKRFEIAVQVSYTPGDLKEVGYKNGRRFEVFDIEGKPAFYEALVKGELSLYRKGLRFYISKKDCKPVKLTEDNMELNEGGEIRKFTSVRGILLYLTAGRGMEVKKEINIKTDLVPLVIEYNSRSGSKYNTFQDNFSEKDLVANIRRSGVNKNTFGILGGTNNYFIHIKQVASRYAPLSMNQATPVYGIFYERVISSRSDKLALRAEAQYCIHNLYSYKEVSHDYSGSDRDDEYVDITSLRIPVMLQYSLRGSRITPFVNAGITYTEFLKRKYIHISEHEDNSHNIYTFQDSDVRLKPFEISPFFGVGTSFRIVRMISVRIEGRVEPGKGILIMKDPSWFKERSMQVSLLFGISF